MPHSIKPQSPLLPHFPDPVNKISKSKIGKTKKIRYQFTQDEIPTVQEECLFFILSVERAVDIFSLLSDRLGLLRSVCSSWRNIIDTNFSKNCKETNLTIIYESISLFDYYDRNKWDSYQSSTIFYDEIFKKIAIPIKFKTKTVALSKGLPNPEDVDLCNKFFHNEDFFHRHHVFYFVKFNRLDLFLIALGKFEQHFNSLFPFETTISNGFFDLCNALLLFKENFLAVDIFNEIDVFPSTPSWNSLFSDLAKKQTRVSNFHFFQYLADQFLIIFENMDDDPGFLTLDNLKIHSNNLDGCFPDASHPISKMLKLCVNCCTFDFLMTCEKNFEKLFGNFSNDSISMDKFRSDISFIVCWLNCLYEWCIPKRDSVYKKIINQLFQWSIKCEFPALVDAHLHVTNLEVVDLSPIYFLEFAEFLPLNSRKIDFLMKSYSEPQHKEQIESFIILSLFFEGPDCLFHDHIQLLNMNFESLFELLLNFARESKKSQKFSLESSQRLFQLYQKQKQLIWQRFSKISDTVFSRFPTFGDTVFLWETFLMKFEQSNIFFRFNEDLIIKLFHFILLDSVAYHNNHVEFGQQTLHFAFSNFDKLNLKMLDEYCQPWCFSVCRLHGIVNHTLIDKFLEMKSAREIPIPSFLFSSLPLKDILSFCIENKSPSINLYSYKYKQTCDDCIRSHRSQTNCVFYDPRKVRYTYCFLDWLIEMCTDLKSLFIVRDFRKTTKKDKLQLTIQKLIKFQQINHSILEACSVEIPEAPKLHGLITKTKFLDLYYFDPIIQ